MQHSELRAAFAKLCGFNTMSPIEHLITKHETTLGRNTKNNAVDVELGEIPLQAHNLASLNAGPTTGVLDAHRRASGVPASSSLRACNSLHCWAPCWAEPEHDTSAALHSTALAQSLAMHWLS